MMKRKWLLAIPFIASQLTITAFAMPIEMNLFGGGLSVLDSLLLIGIGLALIGVLFLCIAFLKPQKKEEEPIADDAFLKQLIEQTAIANADTDEEAEEEFLAEQAEESEEETDQEEMEEAEEEDKTPEEEPEKMEEETETEPEPECLEEEAEVEPEPECLEEETEPEPLENCPTITLTGINNGEFKIFPLRGTVTLGRRPGNDMIFSDTTVSGVHCEILVEEDKVYLLDKGSTNGTYLNGQKITEKTEIHKGDVMVLGQMELKISI